MFWEYIVYGPIVLIVIPGILLGIYAQVKVKSTFSKYSRIGSKSGISGAMMSTELMSKAGIYDVSVTTVAGKLSDHYDPRKGVVALSNDVYSGTSVAALGIAAHEIGHVIQDKNNYAMLKLRKVLVPVVNFSTFAFVPLVMIGIVIEMFIGYSEFSTMFIALGILMYGMSTVFALITLPVEFNASKRAYRLLVDQGILEVGEANQAKKVLDAAALTYVAAFVTSLLYFLRFLMLFVNRRN